ncbi:probable deoxycytidylate deaminase isoform X2 [Musca autumnalis]|uniref:probable deoxycytidylate deaminase isoform X2 n=1 Tax=Musca autumnalis TaxID=221902 RepID=UPI003CF29DBA
MSSDPSKAEMSQQQATTSDPTESNKKTDDLQPEDFYMGMARLAEKFSRDPETKVGAVIVSAEHNIVSVGYNGFPKGCKDDHQDLSWERRDKKNPNMNDKQLYVVHAEADAIIKATKLDLEGAHIYTTLYPCNECAKLIINAGIKEVHYLSNSKSHKRKYIIARNLLWQAGVTTVCTHKRNPKQIKISF